ncbi:hypothetical protein [Pseudomonas anguilliseptica]|uniref:Uncharacterized protein n=1 Tax=Pseudomonas anguilliseptica TaxID=53406 RepID=A0A1H5EDY4_PSEAG|nr:hypothetical protein [Pseudomonas anguilliseptica]SED89342.1 hypothetical protein SAMN05421553_3581 [Pseudomonas anguilliseptica]
MNAARTWLFPVLTLLIALFIVMQREPQALTSPESVQTAVLAQLAEQGWQWKGNGRTRHAGLYRLLLLEHMACKEPAYLIVNHSGSETQGSLAFARVTHRIECRLNGQAYATYPTFYRELLAVWTRLGRAAPLLDYWIALPVHCR